MAKMRAVDAAMYVLEKEGITTAFGVPGAAINPFYSDAIGGYSITFGGVCELSGPAPLRVTRRGACCSANALAQQRRVEGDFGVQHFGYRAAFFGFFGQLIELFLSSARDFGF